MLTVKKIPDELKDENICSIFIEDEVNYFNLVITGNRDYRSFGDSDLIKIINNDYYDDETAYDYDVFEELKKITGKEWSYSYIRGYCQGDWNIVYYQLDTENIDKVIKFIETFYFGKYSEFVIGEDEDQYTDFVPHDVVWNGKKAICEHLGLDPENTIILEDDGFIKEYKYKEIK